MFANLLAVEVLDANDDPLRTHRPRIVDCNNVVGWYNEGDGIEVDTGHCNYLALRDSVLTEARKGSWVTGEVSHFDLTASEPSEAHLAFLIGDEVVWQQSIAIPGAARVETVEFALPTDVRVGDDVGIHLHNHGQNTYLLQVLYVSPTRDVDH